MHAHTYTARVGPLIHKCLENTAMDAATMYALI